MDLELQIKLSVAKIENEMINHLVKASKLDRLGRWEDAEKCLDKALEDMREIGILESNCEGVEKELGTELDALLTGEFVNGEFATEEFTETGII